MNGARYQVKTRNYGAGEWIWRYDVLGKTVKPIEWYEIHDTAGFILFPMAILFWVVAFPLAFWLSRLIFRYSKRLLKTLPNLPAT